MKVILCPAVSLDGFIADESGDSDWIIEEDCLLFENDVKQAGCVIVGRKTFDQYRGSLYPMECATNIVCTSSESNQDTKEIKYVRGRAREIVQQIGLLGHDVAILSGGGDTNGQFATEGMIDEIRVTIYPIVLGQGVKLFGNHHPKLKMNLLKTEQINKGVIRNYYQVNY